MCRAGGLHGVHSQHHFLPIHSCHFIHRHRAGGLLCTVAFRSGRDKLLLGGASVGSEQHFRDSQAGQPGALGFILDHKVGTGLEQYVGGDFVYVGVMGLLAA